MTERRASKDSASRRWLFGILAIVGSGCDKTSDVTATHLAPAPQQELAVTDRFSVLSLTDNVLMLHPGKRKPHRILSECKDIKIVGKPALSEDMKKSWTMAWGGKKDPPAMVDRDYFLAPPDETNGDWYESKTTDVPCPGLPAARPLATCDFDRVNSPAGAAQEHEIYYDLRDAENHDNSEFLQQECHGNGGVWKKMSGKGKGTVHP